mmetsp:Transcript_27683/g.50280  ORF Transcript_27683/g.50280 Transcript_27683/m.50280 type:complete len:207 (-) Transcript_27683:171-791(-)
MAQVEQHRNRKPRVLLGVTGSVAAVKAPELAVRLACELHCDVKVLLTKGGETFWSKAHEYDAPHWNDLQQILTTRSSSSMGDIQVHLAEDEWGSWNRLGDPVMHIDLRDWADVMVVAPLSAHTLAKFATGLCDDTLSCVVRAWDFGQSSRPGKPIILAPAMNTAMWDHPLTASHLSTFQGFWRHRQTIVTPPPPTTTIPTKTSSTS